MSALLELALVVAIALPGGAIIGRVILRLAKIQTARRRR